MGVESHAERVRSGGGHSDSDSEENMVAERSEKKAGRATYTKLTARSVKALRSDNPRGTVYYDDELRGFCVRVASSGTKTFWVRYWRKTLRKWKWVRVGEWGPLTAEDAREEARRILSKDAIGLDPKAEKAERQAALTFGEWVKVYLPEVEARKKRPGEDKLYLPRAVSAFGSKLLVDLNADDIQRAFEVEAEGRGKITANRWLASVRACIGVAWRRRKVKDNPARLVRAYPENPPRSRVLSDTELSAVLERLEKEPSPYFRAAIRLLIETGARESEVLNAKWSDVDLKGKLWRLPTTKGGKPQVVPLTDSTVALLQALPRARVNRKKGVSVENVYIVRGVYGHKPMTNTAIYRKVRDIFKDAKVEGATVHDLRRTYGLAVAKSAGLHVASKLLRHSDIRVTERVYAPLGIDDLRKASEKVDKERGRIVAFHKANK